MDPGPRVVLVDPVVRLLLAHAGVHPLLMVLPRLVDHVVLRDLVRFERQELPGLVELLLVTSFGGRVVQLAERHLVPALLGVGHLRIGIAVVPPLPLVELGLLGGVVALLSRPLLGFLAVVRVHVLPSGPRSR